MTVSKYCLKGSLAQDHLYDWIIRGVINLIQKTIPKKGTMEEILFRWFCPRCFLCPAGMPWHVHVHMLTKMKNRPSFSQSDVSTCPIYLLPTSHPRHGGPISHIANRENRSYQHFKSRIGCPPRFRRGLSPASTSNTFT